MVVSPPSMAELGQLRTELNRIASRARFLFQGASPREPVGLAMERLNASIAQAAAAIIALEQADQELANNGAYDG